MADCFGKNLAVPLAISYAYAMKQIALVGRTLRGHLPYIIVLIACLGLYQVRVHFPDGPFSSHMSNAALSGLALLFLTGPFEFKKFSRPFIVVASALVVMNIIVELGPSVSLLGNDKVAFLDFNTADPWDMVYGVGTVLLILAVSYCFSRRKR